ncbi:MAG: class I SAM-dependent methyltransferase [Candidatus Eisenbacteria bacterium]
MQASKEWQLAREAAERYEQILVPAILGPAAEALVDWSKLEPGDAVVDVGCGTGAAARFAAEGDDPPHRIVGVDVNPGMLEVARRSSSDRGTLIEWFENSAHELPFHDGEFDVALCAQTLQFLKDAPRAVAEMHRVLKPGGRIAVSLWCRIGENPYFDALVDAMSNHIGAETAGGLRAAFALCESDTIRALLVEAGFAQLETTVEELTLELPRADDFVPRHVSATPMSVGFSSASEDARQAVVRDVTERMKSYETDDCVRVPFRTHLAMGMKR